MDKYQALQEFWESFGIDAYDESTVPTGSTKPELPYITYDVSVGDFNDAINLHASIWYYGSSWGPITAKLAEVEKELSRGGKIIHFDNGVIWLTKGRPFAQRVSDPDDMIRRIYLNLSAEYITAE